MYSYALLSAGKRKTESRLLVFVLRPIDFRAGREARQHWLGRPVLHGSGSGGREWQQGEVQGYRGFAGCSVAFVGGWFFGYLGL